MADSDYGGYSGGGYSDGYSGYSGDYAGDGGGLSLTSSGLGLTLDSGGLGLNAPAAFGPSGFDPGAVGSDYGGGADYSFSAPGGLGFNLSDFGGLGLSPDGYYGMQGTFADIDTGPLADYSLTGPSQSTAEMGPTSGLASVLGFLDKFTRNPVTTALLATTPLAPLVGIYNLARASQTPQGAAKAWGGAAGSTIGGAVASAPGALAGGLLGQWAGSKSGGLPGYTGAREPNAPEGAPGMDLGNIAAGLGGLYSANQAAKAAGQSSVSLNDLYGQNSPYAQALRQQLERKDAAAGRRSQYGPREVELQARLAQLYSQTAPQMMTANRAQQQYAQAQRNARLNTLLGLGKSTGAFDWAGRQLRDLWNTGSAGADMAGFQTPMETPSYESFATEAYGPSSFGELGTGTFGGDDFLLNY